MALPAPKPEIDTCNACGKLFPRLSIRLCAQCAMSLENRFEIVREYLEANHGAAVPAIAGATGVSHSDVRKFLEGGRLVAVDGQPGGACSCSAGSPRCRSCRNQLASKLRNLGDQMAEDIGDRAPASRERRGGIDRAPTPVDAGDGRTSYVRRIRRIADGD